MEINFDAIEWVQTGRKFGPRANRPEEYPSVRIVMCKGTGNATQRSFRVYMNRSLYNILGAPENLKLGLSRTPKGLVIAVPKINEVGAGLNVYSREEKFVEKMGKTISPTPFIQVRHGDDWIAKSGLPEPDETWTTIKNIDVVNRRFFVPVA